MKKLKLVLVIALMLVPILFSAGCSIGNSKITLRDNVIANYEQIEVGWSQKQVRNVLRGKNPLSDLQTYLLYSYDFDTEDTLDDLTIYIVLQNDLVKEKVMVYGFFGNSSAQFE